MLQGIELPNDIPLCSAVLEATSRRRMLMEMHLLPYKLTDPNSICMFYRYFLLTSEAYGACVEAGLQFQTLPYTDRTVYCFAGSQADKVARFEGATEIDSLTA